MSKTQEPPPTSATKIITLLEQQKIKQGDPSGTYSINLKHPVVLSNGDSINLAKGFIDTSAQDSNFIRVEPDETEITIKTGMYFTDSVVTTDATNPAWGKWSVDANQRPEGTTYILQNQSEVALNTFFDWKVANNPFAGGATDFNIELQPIEEGDPYYGDMHYKCIANGPPGLPSTLPAAQGQELEQRYFSGGLLNLSTLEGTIDFLYYPFGYVVPAGGVGKNDHTAVITRWSDKTGLLGWKVKANALVTSPSPNPPFAHWFYLSDADGYNYFSDRGGTHIVELTSVKMPLYPLWQAGPDGSETVYPAVTLKYLDRFGKGQSSTKSFSKYPPDRSAEGGGNAGMAELVKYLLNNKDPTNPTPWIRKDDLPDEFKESKHGWGDYMFFQWTQWEDPKDPTSTEVFKSIQFNVDIPPTVGYTIYSGNKPLDTGFVNPISQFPAVSPNGVRQGNILQPWQMTLKPISNPSSNGSEMLPREYTTTININSGNYTYDDLAQLLTDELNKITSPVTGLSNNPSDSTQPINAAGFSSSYLLQTSYELMMQYDGYNLNGSGVGYPSYPNSWAFSQNDIPERFDPPLPAIPKQVATDGGVQPFWVSEDTTRLFSFNTAGIYPTGTETDNDIHMVGAENFSIIFDDTTQRFQILQMHTPIYIDGPEISSNPVIKGPGSTVLRQVIGTTDSSKGFLGEMKTIDTSSGVFLTDLQPRSLWFTKMGFDASQLTHIGPHASVIQDFTGDFNDQALSECKVHPLSLETGRNKTGYFKGVDSLITKNSSFYESPATWAQDSVVSTPVGLRGAAIIEASDDQPFYNIEISGINNQDISGQVFENSLIQAMVGKYFSQGNFTESNGDGFIYTHKGDTPLTIQSLRVRILDTQMQPEEGLGPNSAFILEINSVK